VETFWCWLTQVYIWKMAVKMERDRQTDREMMAVVMVTVGTLKHTNMLYRSFYT